ncbi:hypothetical protein ACFE04_015350 [Oxalis oulophora]
MADQRDEDMRDVINMSMERSLEQKRVRDDEIDPPVDRRRLQRELMAAAAEKRMLFSKPPTRIAAVTSSPVKRGGSADSLDKKTETGVRAVNVRSVNGNVVEELSAEESERLFMMVFGSDVSRDVLNQWTNQGIRFSSDQETSMGLVQHEGGPCGVLAAIQAFVLKNLLFTPDDLSKGAPLVPRDMSSSRWPIGRCTAFSNFASLTNAAKARALVRSMGDILFSCGSNKRAVVVTLSAFCHDMGPGERLTDEMIAEALESLSIESASDLKKILRVEVHTSPANAFQSLEAKLPVFRSRMGAMLFLISALLSRGLDIVQADRDDPSLPLVTAPFGHASQEIVNLLISGEAVPNVFDGRMDLGGGMSLKGISTSVDIGFLTLLEYLNFCKVGQNLKCPKYPIWVIGSESHYTVMFALDKSVQDENQLEQRESQIRKSFDTQDQSGGGGFISVESFHIVLRETNIQLPPEKLDNFTNIGLIVWSEFWQLILNLDESLGGLKDSSGMMGKKMFDIYHFNGIAKSDLRGDSSTQKPRLTKLRVSVPPRWTSEEFIAGGSGWGEVSKAEPPQHAPLADCIRTRWPRAVCNWAGDPPSIV